MLEQIWTFIQGQLQSNNFLSGGAVLMVVGVLANAMRQYPGRVYRWAKNHFILEIDVPDRTEAFDWLNRWLAEHKYTKDRARLLTVSTRRDEKNPENSQPQIVLSPAPGVHYLIYHRRLMILERERKDPGEEKGGGATIKSLVTRESFTIKLFSRDRNLGRTLLEEARELVCPIGDDRITVYSQHYGAWKVSCKRMPRPIESVILEGASMAEIIGYIEEFQSRQKWYNDRGIPHRLGFLFKGPPGSGKSSTVIALASVLKMDVAMLSLTNRNLDDESLTSLISDLPQHTLLLIEDIDCVWNHREKSEDDDSHVSFSGLLNAIDGLSASEGRVLFMTTNFPEKLDPALIRPGRVDHQFEMDNASAGQICRMFTRFYPEATAEQNLRFVNEIKPGTLSMAKLQGHLTKYAESAELAIKHAQELVEKPKHKHVVTP